MIPLNKRPAEVILWVFGEDPFDDFFVKLFSLHTQMCFYFQVDI